MPDYAIVTSVANLPPGDDALCLTALRLQVNSNYYKSVLFANDAHAATAKPGDWVYYDAAAPEAHSKKISIGCFFQPLHLAELCAELNEAHVAGKDRLQALRGLLGGYGRKQAAEAELEAADTELEQLRLRFGCVHLPVFAVYSAIHPNYRSAALIKAATGR